MLLESFKKMAYNGEMKSGTKLIAQNKKARFNYHIEEDFECGIELKGTEVKSVKNGSLSFPDGFAEIIDNEVWLKNFSISAYPFSTHFTHDPNRNKKLLLHKAEIKRLKKKTEEKGYTLIPLDVYLKKGLVKIRLGLCKGKKLFDKRDSIRQNDLQREVQREFRKNLEG